MANQHNTLSRWRALIQSIRIRRLPNGHRPLNRQRRFFLLMGVAAFIASACTGTAAQSDHQAAASASLAVKRVQHALGETEVPINPTQIVVIGFSTIEAVMTLGVQPIGAPGDMIDFMLHLPPATSEITDIGHPREPNLERVLALKPDLILTSKVFTQADRYALLSQIAPTVVFDIDSDAEWQRLTRLCAEVLGKQAEAEKLATDYEAKLQKLKAQFPTDPKQIKISLAYFFPGRIWAFGKDTFSGSILEAVGLSRPARQAQGQGAQISPELLSEIDGDVLFVFRPKTDLDLAADIRAALDQIKADPLWSQLKVVQANQAHEIDTYWVGGGYIAANLILDDLLKYVVPATL